MDQLDDCTKRNLSRLTGFNQQLKNIKFTSWLDWLVKFRDPRQIWEAQPTYLISEWTYLIIGLLTFIHSRRVGGRYRHLWLAILFHGTVIECISYCLPDIDSFWHSQTTLMLIGRRLPLHIMIVYPAFYYNASVAISRLKLSSWVEPFAVGLFVVLIDLPYDITAVKYVHWTWHDTDPNIFDRHYWVPWNSYYFHATFAASFTFWFHWWRRIIIGQSEDKWQAADYKKEMLCSFLTGLCGMPGGVLQFIPFYHPLHDIGGVHTENCVVILAITFILLTWSSDRRAVHGSRAVNGLKGFNECVVSLILHYGCYLFILCAFRPENEVSIGVHERTGPCNDTSYVQTAFGMSLAKRTYLCPSDYGEDYFDFHCLPGRVQPEDDVRWYTICGTPFENHVEYLMMIGGVTWIALIVFFNMFFRSGAEVLYADAVRAKKIN